MKPDRIPLSAALVELIRLVDARPRYLLAKGGITSSDIATHALCVKRAMVLGQVYRAYRFGKWDQRAGTRDCRT